MAIKKLWYMLKELKIMGFCFHIKSSVNIGGKVRDLQLNGNKVTL